MATPVLMPKQGNSVESCLIIEWKKKIGEVVERGEVLLDIETDKAVIEVESPAEGLLLETFYNPDDEVPVQSIIAVIGDTGENVDVYRPASAQKKESQPASLITAIPIQNVTSENVENHKAISPRARALAKANRVSVDAINGTGPHERVIERDIRRALDGAVPAEKEQPITPDPGVKAIPLTGVRKRIASRMLESLQSTAQLTLTTTADATDLLYYRKRFKESSAEFELGNISLNDLVLFAVSRSLSTHPELNALLENDTLYQYDSVQLGFAVDTPRGLLVPVIKDANRLNLKTLSNRAKQIASNCQNGKIAPEQLQGGTFTVSNLGALGVETFTPILNSPQVAILGVGGITLKPVSVAERIEHLPHLNLSLTVDHRAVDGAPAARFLQTLSRNLSSFSSLLLT